MENWTLDGAMEHFGPFYDAMGKLETLAMGKMGPLMIDGEIGDLRPLNNVMGN